MEPGTQGRTLPLTQDGDAAFTDERKQRRNARTTMVQIRKARRSATKLRLLLTSPSGGGKTYSGLLLAKGLAAARS